MNIKRHKFGYIAVAFLIACIYPSLFLKNRVLGKLLLVAGIIAMTLYHRIAGIVALIIVISMLNRRPPVKEGFPVKEGLPVTEGLIPLKEGLLAPKRGLKEGLTFSDPITSSPISFNSPAEFRQKFCLKGVADDPAETGIIAFNYMLSPAFFTLDASGNPTITKEEMDAIGKMEPTSFNKCTPLTVKNGGSSYKTIHNMCDPACDWTMKSAPTTAPTQLPTTIPTIPSLSLSKTTEGFINPMPALRPYIRGGRHILMDGVDNVKTFVTRLKRRSGF